MIRDEILLTWLCAWRLNRSAKLTFGMPDQVVEALERKGWIGRRKRKDRAADGAVIWNTWITPEGTTQADLFDPEAGVPPSWSHIAEERSQ